MSDKYFKVRYSQLDIGSLKNELVERYGLKELVNCRLFKNGLNDVYIVKTRDETYYLRVSFANMHNLTDYEEETAIMISLNENGVNTAVPVKCKNGSFIWSVNAPEGTRYIVLFAEVKNNPTNDNLKRNFNFGQAIAKMHVIADEKNFKVSRAPIDFIELIEQPIKRLKNYLTHRQEDYDFLFNSAQELRKYIEKKLTVEKPYYGFCHGDIQLSNIFFTDDIPTFFYFDCMGYSWRSHDICVQIWNMSLDNDKYIETEEAKNLLEGYNSIRQLSENELDCINAFGALRSLWLMGLHMDLTERNTMCMQFNDEYFNWLINNFKTWHNRIL